MVTGKEKGKRHPTLGNNVMVGAGAKAGPFKVGDNVKIAANAVVLNEIPPNCTAVGVPARIVKRDGMRVATDLIRFISRPCITGDMQVKTNDRASNEELRE